MQQMYKINKLIPEVTKKALTGQNLQKCSNVNLVKTSSDGQNYLSLYTDELTPAGVVTSIARLKMAFPNLDSGFYEVLTDRITEKGFTDAQLLDSVNNVIDSCEYPTPVIGKFLSWDKKKELFTHSQVCELANKNGGHVWQDYDIVEVKGKKFWTLKTM